MPRGGKRERSGRRSTWASGCKFEDTKVIRVPAAIADRVLAIAHHLDSGLVVELVSLVKEETSLSPTKQKILCPKCGASHVAKDGFNNGKQRYVCSECGRKFVEHRAAKAFELDTISKNVSN